MKEFKAQQNMLSRELQLKSIPTSSPYENPPGWNPPAGQAQPSIPNMSNIVMPTVQESLPNDLEDPKASMQLEEEMAGGLLDMVEGDENKAGTKTTTSVQSSGSRVADA